MIAPPRHRSGKTGPTLAGLLGGLAHRFAPGDTDGLTAAIAAARAAYPDPAAAAALCLRLRWDRLFAEELDDLRALAA